MAKDRTEYRIVCNGRGSRSHRLHKYPKRSEAKARQACIDANHHSDMHPTHFYGACAPYVIERRTVTDWIGEQEWT